MQHYHHAIDQIIDHIQHAPPSPEVLTTNQQQLDQLAAQYQGDESLGSERYKLYQAQAMISYWQGDYTKSRQFIQQSVRVRGHSYKLADELIAHLGPEPAFVSKPYKRWWALIFAPIIGLVVIALLQILVHFIFSRATTADGTAASDHPIVVVVNILSVIIGIAAVLGLLCLPVWIIMLLKASRYNETGGYSLSKTGALIIAILLPPFYWLYTYERERVKFWLNLSLCIVTIGYWGIVAWIWGIVEAANKSDAYFEQFPNVER